ncbi:mercury(II) reductase [Halonotius aquaticus]|uniref:Mercuric reductase n=1 Tax=Halonotius aquaticus TaxID=2216978 RepID=A0A3A6PUP8_9EURY|nr:mercury(II) reductase [Halonotius aquaticus]RJX43126.1 mercury(II) reductase [Halonotius aquaticus]
MTQQQSYDLIILGGGAAAFAAITEASSRGLSTALVNTGLPLGGTCVNVGCVPSKHLLALAETASTPAHNPFDAIKYTEGEPSVNWEAALDGTDRLVEQFRQENYVSVAEHFETDIYEGYGRLVGDTTIEITDGEDEGSRIEGEKALIATGSSPQAAPIDGLDSIDYETSETILERRELPESIVIIGGGYIALEWGQILHRVGVDITILQRSERVLSQMEGQLGREIQRCFHEEGINVITGTNFQQVRSKSADTGVTDTETSVVVETTLDGKNRQFCAEELFVATGVKPNSENIGLDIVGIETNERGSIVVDDHFQTANPDVYAAGDVIGKPELETVAAKEGNHAIKNAFGNEGKTIDYNAVPAVVFTSPEVAAVGTTELEYMDEHGTCSCRTVQMEDVPRAKAVKDTRGLLQVVKHHETDEIVGVHMVGPRAADMIPEATLAVKFGLTVDDIIDTIHPFPSFSEAFKHACQAFRRDTSTMSCCVE